MKIWKSREEGVEGRTGRQCLPTARRISSYVFWWHFGTLQTLVWSFWTSTCFQTMGSSSPSSSQCATCQPVLFSAISPLCSSRWCLSRWSNQGPSSWRLQLWALSSVPLWWVATSPSGTSLCPSTRRLGQPHPFSLLSLPIWPPLRERPGLPMVPLFLLLLGLSLQVGYVRFSLISVISIDLLYLNVLNDHECVYVCVSFWDWDSDLDWYWFVKGVCVTMKTCQYCLIFHVSLQIWSGVGQIGLWLFLRSSWSAIVWKLQGIYFSWISTVLEVNEISTYQELQINGNGRVIFFSFPDFLSLTWNKCSNFSTLGKWCFLTLFSVIFFFLLFGSAPF